MNMILNPIFQDGMVLAANKPIRVFGEGGDRVTITTAPQLYGHQLVVKIAKIEVNNTF